MMVMLNAPTIASSVSAKDEPRPVIRPDILFLARVLWKAIIPTGPTGIADAKPMTIPHIKPIKYPVMKF